VEDSFLIQGRGLVLVPGLAPQGDERFRVGDPITLRRPDGTFLRCQIDGLGVAFGSRRCEALIWLKGLGKLDVPKGTEVWSADALHQP
jgi:hypothetical protein